LAGSRGVTADVLQDVAGTWARELVGGWEDWIAWPSAIGDELGTALLGAVPGETLVCDSVTVNLFKLAGAALAARPGVVVCDPGEFPTDRYVLDALGVRSSAARRRPARCAPHARDGRSRSWSSRSSTTARARWPTWRP
jgi:kynureninase